MRYTVAMLLVLLSASAGAAIWDETLANLSVTRKAASETEAQLDEILAKARADGEWCEAVREQLSIPVLTAKFRAVLDQGDRAFDALDDACVGGSKAVSWTREERTEICGGVEAYREAWRTQVIAPSNRVSTKLSELKELCGM